MTDTEKIKMLELENENLRLKLKEKEDWIAPSYIPKLPIGRCPYRPSRTWPNTITDKPIARFVYDHGNAWYEL